MTINVNAPYISSETFRLAEQLAALNLGSAFQSIDHSTNSQQFFILQKAVRKNFKVEAMVFDYESSEVLANLLITRKRGNERAEMVRVVNYFEGRFQGMMDYTYAEDEA